MKSTEEERDLKRVDFDLEGSWVTDAAKSSSRIRVCFTSVLADVCVWGEGMMFVCVCVDICMSVILTLLEQLCVLFPVRSLLQLLEGFGCPGDKFGEFIEPYFPLLVLI